MLLFALVLFVAAVSLAVFCPRILTMGRWQLLHPRVALTAWFGSLGLGALMALSGIALAVVATESLSHAVPHTPEITISSAIWVAAAIIGALIAFNSFFLAPLRTFLPEAHSRSQAVAYAGEEFVGFTLVRYQSQVPEAYALPGSRPEIFLSSSMEILLTESQLEAVLAHELAHLRHKHRLALRIAQINSLLFPGTLAARSLERATRLQIELAADDAAARQVGAAHLANALTVLADSTHNVTMHLRAERLARKRWPAVSRRRLPRGLQVVTRLH